MARGKKRAASKKKAAKTTDVLNSADQTPQRKRQKCSSKPRTRRSRASERLQQQQEKQLGKQQRHHNQNKEELPKQQEKLPLLLDLGRDLIQGTLMRRPSSRNRSPYVADVLLAANAEGDGAAEREVICHVPALDMGGKCVSGATVLMRYARDKKGNKVGPSAVGKYGTPKCEFILQLVWVDELPGQYPALWVGAHPSLGEKLAEAALRQGLLSAPDALGIEVGELSGQVRNIAGTNMRTDFVLTPPALTAASSMTLADSAAAAADNSEHKTKSANKASGKAKAKTRSKSKSKGEAVSEGASGASSALPCPRKMVCEVKMVVDCDFDVDHVPKREQCVYVSQDKPYRRAAIFPWANKPGQDGPDGEKVVSARAIKHVDELACLASGEKTDAAHGGQLDAAVLFVVLRHDAAYFKPNAESCTSFVKHLRRAQKRGVKIAALRVRWGEGKDAGKAFADGTIAIEFPKTK